MSLPSRRHRRRIGMLAVALVVALVAGGCRASGGGARPAQGNSTLITAAELENVNALNAYDAVKRLRPLFLNSRGAVSLEGRNVSSVPVVYVDNRYLGSLDELRNLSTVGIVAIRFISGPDATMRWGSGHGAGVILVQYAPN